MLTALPLANPGDTVEVVDDLMRTVVEWQPVTITTQEWSLLYATPGEPVELYDLSTDPKQTTNVAAKHPAVIRLCWRCMRRTCAAPELPRNTAILASPALLERAS